MPGVLNAGCSNWLTFSADLDRSRDPHLRAIDGAVTQYTANPTDQSTRLNLAKALYSWLDFQPLGNTFGTPLEGLTPRQRAVVALFDRMSRDISGDGVTVNSVANLKGHLASIVIPLTAYRNLAIVATVNGVSDCMSFVPQVESALAAIKSKPLGAALLDGINQKAKTWPFVVCIGNAHTAGGMEAKNACEKIGRGIGDAYASKVTWKAGDYFVGDETQAGCRPPFIALAHELIHAYHFAVGVNVGGPTEEAATVGLRDWWTEPEAMNQATFRYPFYNSAENQLLARRQYGPTLHITENLIRHEHGCPLRVSYRGKIGLHETKAAVAYAKKNKGFYSKELGWYKTQSLG